MVLRRALVESQGGEPWPVPQGMGPGAGWRSPER